MQLRRVASEILDYVERGNTRDDFSARLEILAMMSVLDTSIRLFSQFLSFTILFPEKTLLLVWIFILCFRYDILNETFIETQIKPRKTLLYIVSKLQKFF